MHENVLISKWVNPIYMVPVTLLKVLTRGALKTTQSAMAASASNLASMWTYVGCRNFFVKRHRQLATTFNHCKSHWNTRWMPDRLYNCCFPQRALHGVHSPCSHRSVVHWCGHMRCPCVYCFVSSRSGIIFNPSAGAITDHSQSAKDIDPYFKSQLYVEGPATESRYSVYQMS